MSLTFEKESLRIAFESIKARKTRTFLTVLGIAIGIAAIISLLSVGEGLRNTITGQLASFGANKILVSPKTVSGFGPPQGAVEQLTDSDVGRIKRVRGVELAIGLITRSLPVEFKDEQEILSIYGIPFSEAEGFFSDIQAYQLEQGRFPKPGEKSSVVLGSAIAKDAFSNEIVVRDKLLIKGQTFQVVGILEETGQQSDDMMTMISVDALKELTGNTDELSIIFIKVSDVNNVDATAEEIQKKMDDVHGEDTISVFTTKQLTEQIVTITNTITVFLSGIAGISLLVAGIGISNTMYMSIMERTRTIGIMKAIGASNTDILMIFLVESMLLSLIGGLAGLTVGYLISEILSQVPLFGGIKISTSISLQLLLAGISFSLVVGILSGVFPARKAAKLKPVEALRYE